MKIRGFEGLSEIVKPEPTEKQLQAKVKEVFNRSLEAIKAHERPELEVGVSFLENYHREHGLAGMRRMVSKLSLFVDVEGFEFLKKIGLVKGKL